MLLTAEKKLKLRLMIEDMLKYVPDGSRIELDPKLLKELLFEEFRTEKIKLLLPIWSGEFLKKIDISKISFENVSWSLLYTKSDFIDSLYNKGMLDENSYTIITGTIHNFYRLDPVDYSYTNANIDFSTSWEGKQGEVFINSCNFSGVDLSNNNLNQFTHIMDSDLSNTGLKLSPETLKQSAFLDEVNLSGIDLSKFTINGKSLVRYYYEQNELIEECNFESFCNFTNSGLNIIIDDDISKWNDEPRKEFLSMFVKGYLNGCFINGIRINNNEDIIINGTNISYLSNPLKDEINNQAISLTNYRQEKESEFEELMQGIANTINYQVSQMNSDRRESESSRS